MCPRLGQDRGPPSARLGTQTHTARASRPCGCLARAREGHSGQPGTEGPPGTPAQLWGTSRCPVEPGPDCRSVCRGRVGAPSLETAHSKAGNVQVGPGCGRCPKASSPRCPSSRLRDRHGLPTVARRGLWLSWWHAGRSGAESRRSRQAERGRERMRLDSGEASRGQEGKVTPRASMEPTTAGRRQ